MAVEVARLESWLVAHTRDFDRSMDKSEGRMQSAGKTAGRVGLAIAGGLAFGLERSVKAAMDAQVSQSRLDVAFKNSGLSAARYAGQVNILETSGRKLGFTDEQTKNALGSLLIATKSMSGASKDLSVAQDVARFKHVDLTAATKMLTMAMAGSQRATKQLGIDVPKVTSAQDALKASSENLTTAQGMADLAAAKLIDKHRTESLVIDTVRQKLGGQADAYSKTAAGGMEQFRAQLDHLEVTMGTGLLPILARVSAAVSAGTEYFSKHATLTKVLAGALGVLAAALIAARVVQIAMNLAVLANPYVAAIAAVVAAGIAIYIFRDKIMNVFNWIKDHWPLLTAILAGPIGVAVLQIVQHRDRLIQIFSNLPGQIAGAFAAGTGLVKDAIVGLFQKVIGWVLHALGIRSPSHVFYKIGQQSIQGYIDGVGSMAGVLKKAVVGMVESLPKKALGAIEGIGSALGGEIKSAPGEHSYGSAEKYLVPWANEEGITVTSIAGGQHAPGSYHYMHRAIDVSGSIAQDRRFFLDSLGHFGTGNITELFYDPMGYYIKNGRRVPGAIGGHSDHVHIALDKGGWLPTGTNLITNNTGRPERVLGPNEGGNIIHNHNYNGPVVQDTAFISYLRGLEAQYRRQNGRPAFGA